MRNCLIEQLILISSLCKWTVYAAIIGGVVGVSTSVFLYILNWSIEWIKQYPHYYFSLPATLLLNILIIGLAREAEGGTDKVIEAVHKRMGKLYVWDVPVKLIATVITIATGGSVGKEGPAAQIGATLASGVGDLLKVNDLDRRKLVICGLSAGFSAVFGTPVAGALFGVEVLFLGQMLYDVLFPAFVAGIVSYFVANGLGIVYFYHKIQFINTPLFFIKAIFLGLFCGLVALLLIESLKISKKLFQRICWPKAYKAMLGGGILAVIGYYVTPDYLGLGQHILELGTAGNELAPASFLWKIAATAITVGCGGTGGLITPILVIGAAAGNYYACLTGGGYALYSALGTAALLAGAVNTPISAAVLAIELFGSDITPYATICCAVSYLIAGHRSVYPSQVFAMEKSSSLAGNIGKAIGEAGDIIYNPRPNTLCNYISSCLKREKSEQHDLKI